MYESESSGGKAPVRSVDSLLTKFGPCFIFRFKTNIRSLNESDIAHKAYNLVGVLETRVFSTIVVSEMNQ